MTVARSDYGYLRPVIRAMERHPDLSLDVIVTGMHLSPEFGMTVREVEADGIAISDRVEMLLSSDSASGIAKATGLGVIGLSDSFARIRPDLVVLLGDRFETLAAAVAALTLGIPIAHIAGGEATEGLVDEAIRHSITKMSHLHFVATDAYRRRVIQMGEEPWRVVTSGAPTLDNLRTMSIPSAADLERSIGRSLTPAPLLVTFHPVTLDLEHTAFHIGELLSALDEVGMPVLFTYPNADPHGRMIIEAINRYVETHPEAAVVSHLGSSVYFGMMAHAAAMVGNSSSGIIEAASFRLPVVDIGARQQGRIRGANVLHAISDRAAIISAVRAATAREFRESLTGLRNPYGEGDAAERIVSVIASQKLGTDFLVKRFHNAGVDG